MGVRRAQKKRRWGNGEVQYPTSPPIPSPHTSPSLGLGPWGGRGALWGLVGLLLLTCVAGEVAVGEGKLGLAPRPTSLDINDKVKWESSCASATTSGKWPTNVVSRVSSGRAPFTQTWRRNRAHARAQQPIRANHSQHPPVT